jgi:hypothetical protein
MANFELHVCQNGYWRRLDTFENRDAAMSASINSEHSQRYSGVKVVREVYDERDRVFKTKLVHKWSETFEKTAKDREVDQNLERQRLLRKKLRQQASAKKESWQTKIWNYLVFTATGVMALGGAVALMLVMRGV